MKKVLAMITTVLSLSGCALFTSDSGVISDGLEDTVFFDYNSAELRVDALQTLDSEIKKYSNTDDFLVVVGHTDERGTRDYNLALGEKRANAVKEYLVSNGLHSDRISTISFGKDMPLVEGHNESAWSKNRRAVTVIEDFD